MRFSAIIPFVILFAGLDLFAQETGGVGAVFKKSVDAGQGLTPEAKAKRMAEAEEFYKKRADLNSHHKVLHAFAKLADDFADDYELQWRTSKYYYYLAGRYKEDNEKALPYYKLGSKYGKRAMKAKPGGYDGKYWWMINFVHTTLGESELKILTESKKIKAVCEELIKLDPKRHEAYMLLGGMYRSLPGFPIAWGDNEKSLELLLKAEKHVPDDAELLIEIAESYVALGKKDPAVKYYEKAAKTPDIPGMEFECEDARVYSKKRIDELKK